MSEQSGKKSKWMNWMKKSCTRYMPNESADSCFQIFALLNSLLWECLNDKKAPVEIIITKGLFVALMYVRGDAPEIMWRRTMNTTLAKLSQ